MIKQMCTPRSAKRGLSFEGEPDSGGSFFWKGGGVRGR